MNALQGISASSGIVLGQAFVLPQNIRCRIEKKTITQSELEAGWKRFEFARKQTAEYFKSLIDSGSTEQSAIFQTYILMLSDPDFLAQVETAYRTSLVNIEFIVDEKVREFASRLKASKDAYLMERSEDILDVFGKVLDNLTGSEAVSFDKIPAQAVLAAQLLNPSDAVLLSKHAISALVLQEGGQNSHLSILARTYGIPLIFGIENIYRLIFTGDDIIVDGTTGQIFIQPDKKTKTQFIKKQKDFIAQEQKLAAFINKPAQTMDGFPVQIFANIGSAGEAKLALAEGADGIGLFRTEFLFMNENKPMSEDAQYAIYRQVLELMGKKPVVIRTLDAGGDKFLKIEELTPSAEKNPLLGWRGIRMSLEQTAIFKTQLRALLRAGFYGNLKIMIPLLTDISQLLETQKLLKTAEKELAAEGLIFKQDIPLGIMIETPAAALMADVLAKSAAFFSIGSNDLTQYTLCVDRENTAVAKLFDELHPSVLKLIKYTAESGQAAGISVSVCGEMASRPEAMFHLLRCGINSFSMSPKKISAAKEALSRFKLKEQ